MRIIYFGTPTLSVPFLEAIYSESNFEIVAVVTQPDKPVGRKGILTKPEVKVFSETHNIPVLQFTTLKNEESKNILSEFNADVFVVFAYGKIIPQSILDIPKYGCLNIHPSLLPKYRGASPIQQVILDGEKTTGVSVIQMDSGMDTGAILAQEKFDIDPTETSVTIQKKIYHVGIPMILKTLHSLGSNSITPIPQNESYATSTKLFDKIDGKIDWNKSANEIERMVRAFTPWPNAWFVWNEKDSPITIIIKSAQLGFPTDKPTGTVLCVEKRVYVTCGDRKTIELIDIQPEGKQQMSSKDYVLGHKSFCNTKLN